MHRRAKKKTFDASFNYLEEVYFPTLKQRWFLLHTDIVWYRFILICVVFESLFTIFMKPFKIPTFSPQHLLFLELQVLFNWIYLLDILLFINQKFVLGLHYPNPNPIRRPSIVLIIEMISIVPYSLIIRPGITFGSEEKKYLAIYTLHTLKIVRFLTHMFTNRNAMTNVFETRLFEMVINILLFSGFLVHTLTVTDYVESWDDIYIYFQMMACNVAGRGTILKNTRVKNDSVYSVEFFTPVAAILIWCLAIFPSTCFMILSFIESNQHRYDYAQLIYLFRDKVARKYNLNAQKNKIIMDYFEANWILRAGYSQQEFGEFTQPSLSVEIGMDNFWEAFNHSFLFRNQKLYVLRSLSTRFQKNLRMEGEPIYVRNRKKPGLIYIKEGVVEIVSGDTKLFSLTEGTCIGESTLIFPHDSPIDFQCKTICLLYELQYERFTDFRKLYPEEYKEFKMRFEEVIRKAKKIKEYNDKLQIADPERHQMVWLKYNLHNFMAMRKNYTDSHELTNIYLRDELEDCVTSQKQVFHTYEYLDRLAIRQRSETDNDIVFIQTSCPWILKPNSPVVHIWETFILIVSIIGAIVVGYGFCIEYTKYVTLVIVIIHVIFVLDFIVQIITPISKYSLAKSVGEIIAERMSTKGFICDIMATCYWRMIAFGIDTEYPWYELPKLFKLWRVWRFYSDWSNKFLLNLIFFCIMLAIGAYAMLIYSLSCVFALSGITTEFLSALTIQFATGAGFKFLEPGKVYFNSYTFVLANGLSLLAELFATTIICSVFYLFSTRSIGVRRLITKLAKYSKFEENQWTFVRLHSYFNLVINDESLVGSNIADLFKLPKYFEVVMKSNVHMTVIKRLALFKGLPEELITDLLLTTELSTCFRHAIIMNQGIIYKEVYVLVAGECRTLMNGRYYRTKPLEPLNLLENVYNIPSSVTTVALTEITVLKFTYETFFNLLKRYPVHYRAYLATLEDRRDISEMVLLKLLYAPKIVVRDIYKIPSFKHFGCIFKKHSFREHDYHVPFDKIRPFDFIKFLLMRNTIYPEGPFMKRYEFFQCAITFISAISFTIPALNIGAYYRRNYAFPLTIALDMFALIDIYIRFHIGYYNKQGILVMHPLSTAKYYASHAFFVDALAVFPFDLFKMQVQYRVALNSLHALKMYRIHHLRKYYNYHEYNFVVNTISMVCYILFSANFIAGLIFVYDCYTWDTTLEFPNPRCQTFTFEHTTAHFHILFLVMSAYQCSGLEGAIKAAHLNRALTVVICCICICGVHATIIYKSYIFSCYITRIIGKYEFVVGARKLIGLIRRKDHRDFLCKEISLYYDLHWTQIQTHNIHEITVNMIPALKRDILFRFYGDGLVVNSIFNENVLDTTAFIKNIFLVAKPIVIPKNGYAITINDIQSHVYFLHSGSVDVLRPDGSKLIELTVGALFGNLTDTKLARSEVSVVANVNTQFLLVETSDFHYIIKYFSAIQTTFHRFIKRSMYYIEGTTPIEKKNIMTFEEYFKSVKTYAGYKMVNYVHLFYTCYFGLCLELYQLAVGEMHLIYLCIQYSMDAVHVMREFMRFRMPYKDEHHEPVFKVKQIVAFQMSRRGDFFIMIITTIYLDLFVILPMFLLGYYNNTTVCEIFSICRINRLFRFYYIVTAYHRQQDKISECSSLVGKWMYNTYWFTMSYLSIATITAVLDSCAAGATSIIMGNVLGETVRNVRLLPPKQKMEMFLRYLFFSNLIHLDTYESNYGPKTVLANIYIISLFMYSRVISSFHLARFFESIVDIAVRRKIFLKWTGYLQFYVKKEEGTATVKDRVMENATHTWSKCYNKSEFIINRVCAKYLKETIMADLYGYLITKHPVFGHTHIDFIRQLGLHYKNVMYPCNDVVIFKAENRKCMFFLHRGSVAVYDVDYGRHEIPLRNLTTGESFGLLQGLGYYDILHEFTYITTTQCEIVELEWTTWNYLLDFFPATKQYILENAPRYRGSYFIPHLKREVDKGYY